MTNWGKWHKLCRFLLFFGLDLQSVFRMIPIIVPSIDQQVSSNLRKVTLRWIRLLISVLHTLFPELALPINRNLTE